MTGHRLVTDATERVGLPPAKLAVTPGAGARTLADICGRRIAYAEGTAQQSDRARFLTRATRRGGGVINAVQTADTSFGPSRTLATGFGWKGKWTAWTVSAAGGTARNRRTSIYCMGLFAGDDQYIGAVISR
jgi:hypothetical protein